MRLGVELDDEDVGTFWKAFVTSWRDMRDVAGGRAGGGVSPSSDLTSCIENGIRSSAIPSSELTGFKSDLFAG